MDTVNIISLLVGFILGMILTAFGYHKWFDEYNDTISDLKNRLKDKNMVIKALRNSLPEIQSKMNKEPKNGQEA